MSRKSILHSRSSLLLRLLFLCVVLSVPILVYLRLPRASLQITPLPPTFVFDKQLATDSPQLSILLVIPPFTNTSPPSNPSLASNYDGAYNYSTLSILLDSLVHAQYDNDKIPLTLYLAPHKNASLFEELYDKLSQFNWPHGPLEVRNATSGGFFDLVTHAWVPSRGDSDVTLIIDASSQLPLPTSYYRYLKSVTSRHAEARVSGYAVTPVLIHRKSTASFVSVSEAAPIFLYQNTPGVPSVAIRAHVWRSFQTWFYAHRSEWFLWPTVVAARDKKDAAWDRYHGNSRAHWTLWFSRFCAEYTLYNVYPTTQKLSPLSETNETTAHIETFTFDGNHAGEQSSVSAENLARIIELGRRMGGSVSMTLVNDAFLETARSWICNVDVAKIRPPGVVWFAVDDTAYDGLKKIPDSYAIRMSEFRGGRQREGTSYGTPGYWLLMLERTRLIQSILDSGIGVFAFETDQIWLRDPVPFVDRIVHSGDEVDMVGTLDTRHEIGGNFLYLSPTLPMRRTWREVCKRFERSYKKSRMHGHSAKYRRYMENDQSILTKLVFFDEEFKTKNPTIFRALDTELFVDGRWYDKSKRYYKSSKSQSPILINNNFMIGIGNKKQRAIANGHWFLTENKCNVERVKNAIRANEKRAGVNIPVDQEVIASRIEGADVEAGLEAAVAAIEKEQGMS